MAYKSEFDKMMEEYELEQLGASLGIDPNNLSVSDIEFLEMLDGLGE